MTTISRSRAKARSASGHFSRISRTVMVFIALNGNMFHKAALSPSSPSHSVHATLATSSAGRGGQRVQCSQCRHENPADAKFCLECGRKLAFACVARGTELPPGAKVCKGCGQQAGSTAQVKPAGPVAPGSYTPRHLAERILSSKAALEGERKQVTVLFADLKCSMELLADSDPEDARRLLDPVLEHMMEAVHPHGAQQMLAIARRP